MIHDSKRPLIRLTPTEEIYDRIKRNPFVPKIRKFNKLEQHHKYSSLFKQVVEANELQLRSDPTALAPERLLVFELATPINNFRTAIKNIEGLSLIDEDELETSSSDDKPTLYLLLPTMKALRQIESLWSHWIKGEKLGHGLSGWNDVFSSLRDLRPWGAKDRVDTTTVENLKFDIKNSFKNIAIEIELVFRKNYQIAVNEVKYFIKKKGGTIKSEVRIECIEYHALLVELPPHEILNIIEWKNDGIAGLEPVMYIRPQARTNTSFVEKDATIASVPNVPAKSPIAAILDGVPVVAHPWLSNHLVLDDPLELEPSVLAGDRIHGTAMASLIIYGDRNTDRSSSPLPRKIIHIPVLGSGDKFPEEKLVVDSVYQALQSLVSGQNNYTNDIIIVNLSLGINNYRFCGRISPFARLIDYFSAKYGILFIVSAGNVTEPFNVPLLDKNRDVISLKPLELSTAILSAIDGLKSQRRLLSPAETVNGLTVGSLNSDLIETKQRGLDQFRAFPRIDPFADIAMSNPTSALGPGFATATKPEVLMPGSREFLDLHPEGSTYVAYPKSATKYAGLKVAMPVVGGINAEGWTGGTSAAAALASRTAHRIYDALEDTYQDEFTNIPKIQRAVLLKALLVHSAKWPQNTRDFIKNTVGPDNNKHSSQQKDNIRRYIGYGIVDEDFAVSCAADRATFWATGVIASEKRRKIVIPIPTCYIGQARHHRIAITLAWFTPINVARLAYRSAKLMLLEPDQIKTLAVEPRKSQPDRNQAGRGTVISRIWEGDKAAIINDKNEIEIYVQRQPDSGSAVDEDVSFGLALTIEMPGVNQVYDQVVQMLQVHIKNRQVI